VLNFLYFSELLILTKTWGTFFCLKEHILMFPSFCNSICFSSLAYFNSALTYSLQVRVGVEEGTLEQREDTIVVAGTATAAAKKKNKELFPHN
jgi:hypothetical protein